MNKPPKRLLDQVREISGLIRGGKAVRSPID